MIDERKLIREAYERQLTPERKAKLLIEAMIAQLLADAKLA